MQIHEITNSVNEGVLDWAKAQGAALIAGKKPEVDPATGKFRLNWGQQKLQDYRGQQQRSEFAARALENFQKYLMQEEKTNTPDVNTFNTLLEKWSISYLKPSNWQWPADYGVDQQREIINAWNNAKALYASSQTSKNINQGVSQVISTWMDQTRKQQEIDKAAGKEKSLDSRSHDLSRTLMRELGAAGVNINLLQQILKGPSSRTFAIGNTGDYVLIQFLQGLGFPSSTTPGTAEVITNSEKQNLQSNFANQGIDLRIIENYLSSVGSRKNVRSTGNKTIDTFLTLMGYTIS
jgi:hypothetical protein